MPTPGHSSSKSPRRNGILGAECGGTRTVVLATDNNRARVLQRLELGPANFRLLTSDQLRSHLQAIAQIWPNPVAVGIGMAGVRTPGDRAQLQSAMETQWPDIPCWAGNDLETALAVEPETPGEQARILVLAGTGSCCVGRNSRGTEAKSGGWGHLLGDRGSAYDIAAKSLRCVIQTLDHSGKWPPLGSRFLRALLLNEPADLISWMQNAGKDQVAALAKEVFAAAAVGDRLSRSLVVDAAKQLAADALACAHRLAHRSSRIRLIFAGSVTQRQQGLQKAILKRVRQEFPRATGQPLSGESVWGAIRLAPDETGIGAENQISQKPVPSEAPPPGGVVSATGQALPLTEQRNPNSMNLDRLSAQAAVELMFTEESKSVAGLTTHSREIARVIGWVTRALSQGGRLIYAGAGTSGRLGILDASECPPTFRSPPEWVQGIIAGGQQAVWQAVEGAEDDLDAGAAAIASRSVSSKDVVVGIAASGRTRFVLGAIQAAKKARARTVLLTFNPAVQLSKAEKPDQLIAIATGPEVLTGSTRLKAGTATKLVLNAITTVSMVKLGKVVENLMVDLHPSNAKLKLRAIRILSTLTGEPPEKSEQRLIASGWLIKECWMNWKAGLPAVEARRKKRITAKAGR